MFGKEEVTHINRITNKKGLYTKMKKNGPYPQQNEKGNLDVNIRSSTITFFILQALYVQSNNPKTR